MIGELVGLALRGIGEAKVNIDLVPDVVASERATAQRKPFLMAAAVIAIAGFGAWTVHKSSIAGTAAGKREALEKEVAELKPFASGIDKLAAEQKALESLGSSYAAAQEMRTRWVGILSKIKDYFNSDDVWITDFEPVGLYVPGEFKGAKSRVKQGFATLSYGSSALEELKPRGGESDSGARSSRSSRRSSRSGSRAAVPTNPAINAIRISGFWKDDHGAVNDIIEKIKEDQEAADAVFNLKKRGGGRGETETDLEDTEIFPVFKTSIGDANDLAERFVMVLPLKNPIEIK